MLAEAWPETPVAAEGQPEMRENRPDGKDSVQGLVLLPLIYQAGAVAAFLFYGLCYVRLWRLLRRGERVKGEGWTAILTDEPVEPFSVGRFVVMNREDYRAFPLIRLHEQMHVRLRHTLAPYVGRGADAGIHRAVLVSSLGLAVAQGFARAA